MPSLTYLAAALAASTAVLATPVTLDKRSTFTVEQVARSKHIKNGPEQMIKTLRKYGKPVPDQLLKAAADAKASFADAGIATTAAAGQGTDPAVPSDQYDSSYLSPVTIAGTTVHLDFDTGSSDL